MKTEARRPLFFLLFFTGLIFLFILAMQPFALYHFFNFISVLFPAGWVAKNERNLLFVLQFLMLLVVIPVYVLTFIFSWRYSAKNPKGEYDPDLVDNTVAECVWWGLPFVMTLAICILTWVKTEELDPYKPIVSDKKALVVQVVALDWKWLFIYPEQDVATVNALQIPAGVPIHFEITADAPMNSFWIPDLGGQIYAMPSMKTNLYLIADKEGVFRGSSANLSGEGFAGMYFSVLASSEEEFNKWVTAAKMGAKELDWATYKALARPSSNNAPESFVLGEKGLFEKVVHQYMQME